MLNPNLNLSFQDLLFDNMLVCPRLALFDSLSFCMLSFQLFLYFSIGLFPLSFHVHTWRKDGRSKGATSKMQAKWVRMQARRCKPKMGNVQQIRRPSLLEQFPPSLSLLAFSLEPYTMVSFHCSLHKPRFLGMVMFYLHFSYLVGPYPWNVANVCFTFPLYMIALCMMYIYLYMLVCA